MTNFSPHDDASYVPLSPLARSLWWRSSQRRRPVIAAIGVPAVAVATYAAVQIRD